MAKTLVDKGVSGDFVSVAGSSVAGMTTVVECSDTPSWSLNGEQTLAELDALHHTLTRLTVRRLELLRHLDQLGHAKDLGARDTTELLSLRHRLDPHTVRRDLRTADGLARY